MTRAHLYDHIGEVNKTKSDLDDAAHKSDHVGKLVHVDVEVGEAIAQSLVGHDLGPFPYRPQALQVAGRVEGRVRRLGKVHSGHGLGAEMRRHGGQGRLRYAAGRSAIRVVNLNSRVARMRRAPEVGPFRIHAGRIISSSSSRRTIRINWLGCLGLSGEETHGCIYYAVCVLCGTYALCVMFMRMRMRM